MTQSMCDRRVDRAAVGEVVPDATWAPPDDSLELERASRRDASTG